MISKIGKIVNPIKQRCCHWAKKHQNEIILLIGIFLISLLSFSVGYLMAKNEAKTPIRFENPNK